MKYLGFVVLLFGTAILILYSGLALPTIIALLILILAVSLDFLTTWVCLRMKGREGNPVVAFLFRKMGVGKSFGLMVVLWTCFIVFRWLNQAEGIQTAVAITYWWVPVNNVMVLTRLKRQKCES